MISASASQLSNMQNIFFNSANERKLQPYQWNNIGVEEGEENAACALAWEESWACHEGSNEKLSSLKTPALLAK